jgi:hypothetical protein
VSGDRYEGWTHGVCDPASELRCECCYGRVESGYFQGQSACCDACAEYLLTEISLDDLLMLDKLVTIADTLNTTVLDSDLSGISQELDEWLTRWTRNNVKHKPA